MFRNLCKAVIIFIAVVVVIFAETSFGFCMEMQLYRNREQHFSIKIPSHFNYHTPRGPNVVMTAADKTGNSVNIIIKKVEVDELSDDDLKMLLEMRKEELERNGTSLIDYKIIDIPPNNRGLLGIYEQVFKYPDTSFVLDMVSLELVSRGRFFTISYAMLPQSLLNYESVILQSFGSFVDETGSY